MSEELIYVSENDYQLHPDSPAGVWIEVDNLAIWIRRDHESGVIIEVCLVGNEDDITLDTLHVQGPGG